MSVEVCVFYMEDGVEIVVTVAAEESDILLDAIDLTSSNCWLSVSVCCNRSRSSVLRLVACNACVVMRLEMRELDSWRRSSVACILEAVEMARSSTRVHMESSLSPYER